MSIILGNCHKDIINNFEKCSSKRNIIDNISKVLHECGIDTLKINTNLDETIWIRDIYFIIDDQCFICNLTNLCTMNTNRYIEKKDLIQLLDKKYKKINYIPRYVDIEGGDIIQSNNDIFVGIGARTNFNSTIFLKTKFPHKRIIPIYHSSLHLDCVFTVLNNNQILFHSEYVESFTIDNYEKLDIKDYVNSDNPIPCNFFIYQDNIVCSDMIKNEKLLDLLKILNYRVFTINIGNLWKEGGGIRCLTQWYTTIRKQNIY